MGGRGGEDLQESAFVSPSAVVHYYSSCTGPKYLEKRACGLQHSTDAAALSAPTLEIIQPRRRTSTAYANTFFSPGKMSITSPDTYCTQGLAIRMGSVMLLTSTVPTLAAASSGVKMK